MYLEAQEAFSDWFDHFHRGQPKRPVMPENPTFTEKVAHEQREKQYLAELDRYAAYFYFHMTFSVTPRKILIK